MLTAHLTKARQPPSPGAPPKPVGCGWIPSLYLHRYMRLTPLYFFVLGCYYFLMRVVDSGPWWGLLQRDYDMCAKYVWTNLLYINTLYPWTVSRVARRLVQGWGVFGQFDDGRTGRR